jgi:hypothetical protein
MSNIKENLKKLIKSQPEDATLDEIFREITFERMIEKGLLDSRENKVLTNEEMKHCIKKWLK